MALQFTPGTTKPTPFPSEARARQYSDLARHHYEKYASLGRGISAGLAATASILEKRRKERKQEEHDAFINDLTMSVPKLVESVTGKRASLMGKNYTRYANEDPHKVFDRKPMEVGWGADALGSDTGATGLGESGVPLKTENMGEMFDTGITKGRFDFERDMHLKGITDRAQIETQWNALNQEITRNVFPEAAAQAILMRGKNLGVPGERTMSMLQALLGDTAMGQGDGPGALGADLRKQWEKDFPVQDFKTPHGLEMQLRNYEKYSPEYNAVVQQWVYDTYGSSGYTQSQLDRYTPDIARIFAESEGMGATEISKQIGGLLQRAGKTANVAQLTPVTAGTRIVQGIGQLFGDGQSPDSTRLDPNVLGREGAQDFAAFMKLAGQNARIELVADGQGGWMVSGEGLDPKNRKLAQEIINRSSGSQPLRMLGQSEGAPFGAGRSWNVPGGGGVNARGNTVGAGGGGMPVDPAAGAPVGGWPGILWLSGKPADTGEGEGGTPTDKDPLPGQKLIDEEFENAADLLNDGANETPKKKRRGGTPKELTRGGTFQRKAQREARLGDQSDIEDIVQEFGGMEPPVSPEQRDAQVEAGRLKDRLFDVQTTLDNLEREFVRKWGHEPDEGGGGVPHTQRRRKKADRDRVKKARRAYDDAKAAADKAALGQVEEVSAPKKSVARPQTPQQALNRALGRDADTGPVRRELGRADTRLYDLIAARDKLKAKIEASPRRYPKAEHERLARLEEQVRMYNMEDFDRMVSGVGAAAGPDPEPTTFAPADFGVPSEAVVGEELLRSPHRKQYERPSKEEIVSRLESERSEVIAKIDADKEAGRKPGWWTKKRKREHERDIDRRKSLDAQIDRAQRGVVLGEGDEVAPRTSDFPSPQQRMQRPDRSLRPGQDAYPGTAGQGVQTMTGVEVRPEERVQIMSVLTDLEAAHSKLNSQIKQLRQKRRRVPGTDVQRLRRLAKQIELYRSQLR